MDTAKFQELLLKFEGRIGPNSLMQGAIVIMVIGLILNALTIIIPFIGILGWALLYPMFCIYAKRLHDGGKPAVWTLAVLGAYIVVGMVLSVILTPLIAGDMVAAAMRGDSAAALGMEFRLKSFIIAAIGTVVTHLGVAFIVNQFVKGDPAANAYGEPPADAASPNPLS
ncbi:DUF805 domain-containing protein [Hyphobacterium marinum]|uniref:DUF805 domain-containing protein n=1 Tax=Hyphobacterium marinum TaxID=3116574 RepID=A0ABU7M0C9_9PROT|nr:hypothetical protein [Hyphobacterium sp. Y6023]MEE2567238.1 hypothetical protein [Hyphobacterium sp. Y6023]